MVGSAAVAVQLSGPLTMATVTVLSMQHSFLFGKLSIGDVPAFAPVATAQQDFQEDFAGFSIDHHLGIDANSSFIDAPENKFLNKAMMIEIHSPFELGTDGEEDLYPAVVSLISDSSSSVMDSDKSSLMGEDNGKKDADGQHEIGTGFKTITGEVETNEAAKIKSKRSSVLSLWFFDSLFSHIWTSLSKQKEPIQHQNFHKCTNCNPTSMPAFRPPKNTPIITNDDLSSDSCLPCNSLSTTPNTSFSFGRRRGRARKMQKGLKNPRCEEQFFHCEPFQRKCETFVAATAAEGCNCNANSVPDLKHYSAADVLPCPCYDIETADQSYSFPLSCFVISLLKVSVPSTCLCFNRSSFQHLASNTNSWISGLGVHDTDAAITNTDLDLSCKHSPPLASRDMNSLITSLLPASLVT